jgi:SWI/SNF-related matrix-associated actin-dependent regulator 1 of chromatin subfamily A
MATKQKQRTISFDGSDLVIECDYDSGVVASIKSLPRRKWNPTNKFWTASVSAGNVGPVRSLAEDHGFALTDEASKELDKVADEPLIKVQLNQGDFDISFEPGTDDFYNCLEAVKSIPGRNFNPTSKTWTVPGVPKAADGTANFITRFNVKVGKDVTAHLSTLLDGAVIEEAKHDELTVLSRQDEAESDFEIKDFGVELYPFQKAGVEYVLKTRRTFIADEQGLGKTFQAIASIHAADAFPVVIVCQGNMKYGWQRAWKTACPDRVVDVLSGKKALRIPDACDVVIINYDILDSWKEELIAFSPKSLVNDESHNLKNPKAKRTQADLAIANLIPDDGLVLNLTGTSVLNRPKELAPQLKILGREKEFGGFKFFLRYCGAYKDRFGWNMDGATHLDELNEKLRGSCFVRRLKSDVLKELPAKQRAIIPMEIDNLSEYRAAEDDVIGYLRKSAEQKAEIEAEEAGLSKAEKKKLRDQRANTAAARASQAEVLVQIQTLKQIAARGKVDAAIEWAADFIESEKLVLFVHHRDVAESVRSDKRLAKSNMASISGGMDAKEKQNQVDKFQNDESCRIIVCSLKAANTGITLTAASNVAFLEVGWTPAEHDQAEDRCHRIGQTDSVTAWYLIAQGTIDERIVELIESKRTVTSAIMDGGENPAQTSILRDLMRGMLGADDVEDL